MFLKNSVVFTLMRALELGFFIRQGVVWTHWLATD